MKPINNLSEVLLQNKSIISGLAIIAVIAYHFYNVSVGWHSYMVFLVPGFIGVDWFIFFSGYSLCFSMKKNDLKTFYIRRIKRILPMYLVLSLTVTLIHILIRGGEYSLFDVFCNLTTLNYYGVGGFFIDWYLSVIFLFYLLFPILFIFVDKFHYLPAVLALLSGAIMFFTELNWWYDVAIARVPIYSLGILFFIDSSKGRKVSIYNSFVFLIIFFVGIFFKMRGCFLTDMISPFVLLIISYVLCCNSKIISSKSGRIMEYMGKHSLEIYIGNVIACNLIGSFKLNQWEVMGMYIVLNIVISAAMIWINCQITNISLIRRTKNAINE